ncbi:hypothetical protein [Azospirillum doebereinerae]
MCPFHRVESPTGIAGRVFQTCRTERPPYRFIGCPYPCPVSDLTCVPKSTALRN